MSKKHAIPSNLNAVQKYSAVDVNKDPYLSRHGTYLQCKLCLTTHTSQNSYLVHSQGKRHRQELEKRAQLLVKRAKPKAGISAIVPTKFVKIGIPNYRVTKVRSQSGNVGLLIKLSLPQLSPGQTPRYRIMSSFEQRVEPENGNFQYLVLAAQPYDTVAIKIPKRTISNSWDYFDIDSKDYYVQILL